MKPYLQEVKKQLDALPDPVVNSTIPLNVRLIQSQGVTLGGGE